MACWLFSYLLVTITFHGFGTNLPSITDLLLYPNFWIILCPVPWLVYAILLSRRSELSRKAALIFAVSVTVATLLLLAAIATACILPLFATYSIKAE
jgi:hypothetical protein